MEKTNDTLPRKRKHYSRDKMTDFLAIVWSFFYFAVIIFQAINLLSLEPTEFQTVTSIITFIVGFYFGRSRVETKT